MDRRRLLLGASTLAAMPAAGRAAALPVPPGGALGFKVLRNGTPVGEHHLQFSQSGDDLTVAINAALVVKIFGITAASYNLTASERWSAGVFQSLDSQVIFNGNLLQVHVEKVAGGYAVEGTNHDNPAKNMPRYIAPPDTRPLTYWNKDMLSGSIVNPQTAHTYLSGTQLTITPNGWNRLPTASGGTLVAQRFDITGKLTLSVWYDQNNAWSGLEFQKSGDFTYQKFV
jgi:hypothetical protein